MNNEKNKIITVANFVNLANDCVGIGLIPTGQKNFHLADDYAKQEAILFANFRYDFQLGEAWAVRQEEKRLGGMITWRGAADDRIWEEYQASKGQEIKFRSQVQFDIILHPGTPSKMDATVREISYVERTAVVEYYDKGKDKIEYRKFLLSKLYLPSKTG